MYREGVDEVLRDSITVLVGVHAHGDEFSLKKHGGEILNTKMRFNQ